MSLESKIESVLFYKNEPVELKKLCEWLETGEEDVKKSLKKLGEELSGRGVTLIEEDDCFMLATDGETSELLDKIAKEELSRDIGKAGLETLSIILYKGQTTRREIDYVRGVNSTFILRSLMTRGLIEKSEKKGEGGLFIYKPTIALLAHLGLNKLEELPDFERVNKEVREASIAKGNPENA